MDGRKNGLIPIRRLLIHWDSGSSPQPHIKKYTLSSVLLQIHTIYHLEINFKKIRSPALEDKQPPPTHQAMKRGYSFPNIDAWGPLFMTRDWGHSNIIDSEGQRFLGNQHKESETMLQEQTSHKLATLHEI